MLDTYLACIEMFLRVLLISDGCLISCLLLTYLSIEAFPNHFALAVFE